MLGDMEAPVSVVIPCYCCQDTIERAVASVAAQTWCPAEVILVDDASPDDTFSVLQAIAKKYPPGWLHIIQHATNKGPGASRNTGWNMATQPYVAFLDADDAWHPKKIEIQLKYMQCHPEIAITGHGLRQLKEDISFPILPEQHKIIPLSRWRMLLSNRISTITVMLRRNIELRFEPDKRYSEDYLLWLKIICKGYKGAFIDLDLAYIYKASYGEGGLSGKLWSMEKGELNTYWRLRNERLISWPTFLALSVFSMAKYVRRLVICKTMPRLPQLSDRSRIRINCAKCRKGGR